MKMANHDNLTGLPNRRLFMERFRQAVSDADGNQSMVAILFIDLDDFKPVNDRFGHRAGDRILKEVGERLQASLRKTDLVGICLLFVSTYIILVLLIDMKIRFVLKDEASECMNMVHFRLNGKAEYLL